MKEKTRPPPFQPSMGGCLFRWELLTDHEPVWKPAFAGRAYVRLRSAAARQVRPHPGPLPQERENHRQSQSQPMVPVDGRFMES
jgi:hypothetical protein